MDYHNIEVATPQLFLLNTDCSNELLYSLLSVINKFYISAVLPTGL